MKTKFFAVLHVTAKQFTKLANLTTRVIGKLTENISVYAAPDPSVADLTTENQKLITLNGQAKGNTQKKDERDAQALVVFDMLKTEVVYVNSVALGDKVKVDKSGFDADKEPEPHDVPDIPTIKTVVDGKAAHSAKINLARPLARGLKYSAQYVVLDAKESPGEGETTPPDDNLDFDSLPWTTPVANVNSNELVLLNLKRGSNIAIRVRAEDGSKKSEWGDPFFFLVR